MSRQGSEHSSSGGAAAGREVRDGRLAGLKGFIEAVRRVPAMFRRPETLMLVMAIFASIGIHMPPYMGLGALVEYFKENPRHAAAAPGPVEVSFELEEPEVEEPEAPEPPEADETKKDEAKKDAAEEPKAEEPTKVQPEPKKKVAELKLTPQQPPPPPPSHERKQSITQKSDDPDVESPEDAKFLAEEARRVEEESVAMVRDEIHDDPEPEARAPQDRGTDEAGSNTTDEEGFHDEGLDEGQKVAETPEAKTPSIPEPREVAPRVEAREAVAESPQVSPAPPLPGTVIHDPMGSFTIARAQTPQERRSGRSARTGHQGPNLQVSWQVFEDTYSAETLARERVPKRRKRAGSSRGKRWKEYLAAIENYVEGVRPGNTTALNAAADPFAGYIAAFHRHLHREFAHRFLRSLPSVGALADPELMTKIEMVVNPDGTLHRVGVVKSSGQTMYDFGAFNAVKSGEPYPQPPSRIRSADGKVYIRWALYRNHSQCGTWNAEPFIVRDPIDVGVDDDGLPPVPQLGPVRKPRSGPG